MISSRLILLAAAPMLLAGCGGADPASETPVDLKPGKYDVFVRGSHLFEAPDNPGRSDVCLSEFEAREWPKHPLEKTTRKFNGCFDTIDEPKGNALSGTRKCPKGTATFTGEHSDERFTVRGTVKSSTSDKEEGFTISGRRTGDC